MSASYLTQEDGDSHILLEDGTGALIVDVAGGRGGADPAVATGSLIKLVRIVSDDEDAIALALILLDC